MPNIFGKQIEQKFRRNKLAIYTLACIFTIILFWAHGAVNDILNDDGINYIYAAHALSEGFPEQAKSYRPEVLFYSQITFISSLAGLDIHTSAMLLSLFWQVLLATGFIAIIRSFDCSLQSQVIALAVFFSMTNLNHLRPDIIRGFGFWALQLWAIWAGLSFIKHRAWPFALLWLGLCFASILWRAEGIAYLLLIPIFALLSANFTRGFMNRRGLKITLTLLATVGLIFIILSTQTEQPPSNNPRLIKSQYFSAVDKWHQELNRLKQASDNFSKLKDSIADAMPTKWAQRSVSDLVIGGFIFHIFVTLIKTTNAPLIALSLFGGKIRRPFFRDPRHKMLASYFLVGVIVALVSVYSRFFISTRYIMLPAILLCIPVTFALSQSYSRLSESRQATARLWRYALFSLPLLICFYPLSHQDDEKRYIREAAHWVKTHISSEQNIYFNEQKVAFYTGDYTNDSFRKQYTDITHLVREGFQYAVMYEREAGSEHLPIQQSLKEHRLKTFQNNRGRSVNVYQLPTPDKNINNQF